MDLTSKQKLYLWLIAAFIILIDIVLIIWMQNVTGNLHEQVAETREIKTLAGALGLNINQLEFFNLNEKEYSNTISTLHKEINNKNREIADELFRKNYNEENVNRLIEDVGGLNNEVDKVRFKYLQKLSSVLSNEQLNIFKEIINQSLIEWNDTLIVPVNEHYTPRPRRIL